MNAHKAIVQLLHRDDERSDEEVGRLMAVAYPEVQVHTFVNIFLTSVDMERFDTGHVDCPLACIHALLAYQKAGGQLLSR